MSQNTTVNFYKSANDVLPDLPRFTRVKTVLFTLFKVLKFELGVPGSEIEGDNRYGTRIPNPLTC